MASAIDKKKANSECIRVIIRARPLSNDEIENGKSSIVSMDRNKGEVAIKNPTESEQPKNFTFDCVYDHHAVQEQIFLETAFPIIENVLEGYNGTIFAYGQTGTGKTHTMEGIDDPAEERGIMPRSFESVFKNIQCTNTQNMKQFLVRASYLEIYNESIHDLLSKDPNKKLELKEKPDAGVYVKDLNLFMVKTAQDLQDALSMGRKNRKVGQTLMNRQSSRSHSIFAIVVECSEVGIDGKQHIKVGKLNMVDLAGSERQSKTGAVGDRFIEATKINLSLSTLCHVISALVDPKATYVPYRDSKLTRLLQDSLGGNTKTVMVANIGPADYNFDETINTLRYASRAKHITNKPKINEDPKDTMIREFQEEILKLREQLEKQAGMKLGVPGAISNGNQAQIVEIEKVIHYEDKEKMKELEQKLENEKKSIIDKIEEERKRVDELKDIAEGEKKKLLDALEKQEEEQKKVKERQSKLIKKLKNMEEKLLVGTKVIEQAQQQELELQKAQAEIEEKRIRELRLANEIKEREEEHLMLEKNFSSQQEELEDKSRKLKKLWSKYQETQSEVRDVQDEYHREREEMMDTIRELTRQLKLKNILIDNFIPPEEYIKIERQCQWVDEESDWYIPNLEFTGNNIQPMPNAPLKNQGMNPEEAELLKSQYDQMLNMDLDFNEHSLSMEEYANAIRAQQEYGMAFFSNGEQDGDPACFNFDQAQSVYYRYTEDGAVRDESEETAAKPKKKKKGSSKRPTTAVRKKKKDTLNGDFISLVEAKSTRAKIEQAPAQTQQKNKTFYPKSKNIVKT